MLNNRQIDSIKQALGNFVGALAIVPRIDEGDPFYQILVRGLATVVNYHISIEHREGRFPGPVERGTERVALWHYTFQKICNELIFEGVLAESYFLWDETINTPESIAKGKTKLRWWFLPTRHLERGYVDFAVMSKVELNRLYYSVLQSLKFAD